MLDDLDYATPVLLWRVVAMSCGLPRSPRNVWDSRVPQPKGVPYGFSVLSRACIVPFSPCPGFDQGACGYGGCRDEVKIVHKVTETGGETYFEVPRLPILAKHAIRAVCEVPEDFANLNYLLQLLHCSLYRCRFRCHTTYIRLRPREATS